MPAYESPRPDLMVRIPIPSFIELSRPEQTTIIQRVRALRMTANEEAKIRAGRMTKSARRNQVKRKGARPKMSEAKLMAALEGLTPEQIETLKAIYT